MKTGQAQSGHWSDLRSRLLSAAVMIPIVAFILIKGGMIFGLAMALLGAGLAYEGATMLSQSGDDISQWRRVLLCAWPVICVVMAQRGAWSEIIYVCSVSWIFGWRCLGLIVPICLGVSSLVYLRFWPETGLIYAGFVITVVVASDSFAYLAGRLIGGKKLAPRISPNKTWSGALGGLSGAALVGLGWAIICSPGCLLGGFLTGALLGMVAQAGDMAESAAKRWLGVKDSGRLIPGHGGLLDRLDGLLVAAPFAALLTIGVTHQPLWCFAFLSAWQDLMAAFLP